MLAPPGRCSFLAPGMWTGSSGEVQIPVSRVPPVSPAEVVGEVPRAVVTLVCWYLYEKEAGDGSVGEWIYKGGGQMQSGGEREERRIACELGPCPGLSCAKAKQQLWENSSVGAAFVPYLAFSAP